MTFTFKDDFFSLSDGWSDTTGNWTAVNGTYFAQAPSNSPETYSGLPHDFTNANFSLTVTINSLRDEGIWLDTDGTINNGIVLVLGGNAQAGNWAYWHTHINGALSAPLAVNTSAFTRDLNYTVTVQVNGDIYRAYLDPDGVFDGNSTLLTTLVNDTFTHGNVGLYQFSGGATSFSNFSVSGSLIRDSLSLALTNDTGSSPNDNITKDATLAGTADPNAAVTLTVDGGTAATVTADGSGNWTYKPTGLSDSSHTVVVSETDTLGGVSTTSLNFLLDTTTPAVTEGLKNDTGSSASDNITKDATLTGSVDANAVVHFTVDGNPIADTVTANTSGVWSYTPTGLADGSHAIVASETDAAGNTGTASLAFTLDTDATAVSFTDNFSPLSTLWSNSVGNWTGGSGKYFAQAPSNGPETISVLPYVFTNSNLSVTVTVNDLSDGGIRLDSDGTQYNGVVFVLGGNGYGGGNRSGGAGNSAYWAVWHNGVSQQSLSEVDGVFTPGGTAARRQPICPSW